MHFLNYFYNLLILLTTYVKLYISSYYLTLIDNRTNKITLYYTF